VPVSIVIVVVVVKAPAASQVNGVEDIENERFEMSTVASGGRKMIGLGITAERSGVATALEESHCPPPMGLPPLCREMSIVPASEKALLGLPCKVPREVVPDHVYADAFWSIWNWKDCAGARGAAAARAAQRGRSLETLMMLGRSRGERTAKIEARK
jgi:hypothetical protein